MCHAFFAQARTNNNAHNSGTLITLSSVVTKTVRLHRPVSLPQELAKMTALVATGMALIITHTWIRVSSVTNSRSMP